MQGYSREIMDFIAMKHLRWSDLTPDENNSFEIKDSEAFRKQQSDAQKYSG